MQLKMNDRELMELNARFMFDNAFKEEVCWNKIAAEGAIKILEETKKALEEEKANGTYAQNNIVAITLKDYEFHSVYAILCKLNYPEKILRQFEESFYEN